MLVAGLALGWPSAIPASLVLLGGLYGAELVVADAPIDAATPFVAVGVYVTAELGYWSLEELEPLQAEPGEAPRRLAFVVLLALGALLLSAALLALADNLHAGGLAVDLVGAAAAAAAVVSVVVLARRA